MSVRSAYRRKPRKFTPEYAKCKECGRPYPLARLQVPKGRGGVMGHVVEDKKAECHACLNNRMAEMEKAKRRVGYA